MNIADDIYLAFKKWYGNRPINRRLVSEEAFRAGVELGFDQAITTAKDDGWPENLIDTLKRRKVGKPKRINQGPLIDDGRRPEGNL